MGRACLSSLFVLLMVLGTPALAGGPKWEIDMGSFTLFVSGRPVPEIPGDVGMGVKLGIEKPSRIETFASLAEKCFAFAHVRDTQGDRLWFTASVDPHPGVDPRDPISWPDSIALVAYTDDKRTPASVYGQVDCNLQALDPAHEAPTFGQLDRTPDGQQRMAWIEVFLPRGQDVRFDLGERK